MHKSVLNVGVSEPSKLQYEGVNHLNQVEFMVNKKVLTFLLDEFKNPDSKFFVNKLHPSTEKINHLPYFEKIKVQKEVFKHNAVYYNNLQIISIASLYSDCESFYFTHYLD